MDASIYRLRLCDVLAICVICLLMLGVIMVQSASSGVTGSLGWAWSRAGMKHAMYALVALATFFLVGRCDYSALLGWDETARRTRVYGLAALSLFLNLIVLVPHVGLQINGARRWLPLGFTQLQPSELAKWSTVCFLAYWLTYRPVNLEKFPGLLVTLVPIGLTALLVVIQDFGTATLIVVAAVCMMLAGRVKLRHLAIVIPPAIAVGMWFIMHKPYRRIRIMAFMNPWASPQGEGYHMIQSLLSFSTGGVFGRGLGNGIQKLGYLPEDTTDFIFAVICEELGLFGALLTIALYAGVLYVAWQTVMQKRDELGKMLAFGVAIMLTLQAAINMAVATVSVPTKGLSLPLISAGGSGLVITCGALGLLYSVARRDPLDEAAATEPICHFAQPDSGGMRLAA